jgi:hypothetical protein
VTPEEWNANLPYLEIVYVYICHGSALEVKAWFTTRRFFTSPNVNGFEHSPECFTPVTTTMISVLRMIQVTVTLAVNAVEVCVTDHFRRTGLGKEEVDLW